MVFGGHHLLGHLGVDNLSDPNMQPAGACCPTFLTHSATVLLVWKPVLINLGLLIIIR